MAAKKRTPDQLALDREWLAAMASRGLSPKRIHDLAQQDSADPIEQARRLSIRRLSSKQVGYDLRWIRRRALATATDTYKALLDRALLELSRIGFADMRSVMEWGPNGATAYDSHDLTEDEAASISRVSMKSRDDGKGYFVDVEQHGKVPALRELVRYLGGVVVPDDTSTTEKAGDVIDRLVAQLAPAEGDSEEEPGGVSPES